MGHKKAPIENGRLNRIRIKIERAKKHLRDLDAQLAEFGDLEQHVLLGDVNPATGASVKETNLRVLPADAIGAAGDIAHNLRTALDHLAYQLVLANGGTPTKQTGFPIFEDVTAYDRYKARKVEGMSPLAIEAIDSLKPYGGGNEPLWRLHQLDNIDKHRMLFAIDNNFLARADWIDDSWGFHQILIKSGDPDFAGIFYEQMEKDMYLDIEKAIDEPKVSRGNAMLPTLHQLVEFVENLIFEFEPLLR